MGSSSSGMVGNPMYLSQGSTPIPDLPIARKGAASDNPQTFGQYQEFLPTIQAAGGTAGDGSYTIPSNAETRAAPSATGLKSEMFQYRSPGSTAVSNSGANTGGSSGAGSGTTSTTTSSGGTGTASQADVDDLKKQLAALQASSGQQRQRSAAASGSPTDGPYPSDLWGY